MPDKEIYQYANYVKEKYPDVWRIAGKEGGNKAFKNLTTVIQDGKWTSGKKWFYTQWLTFHETHRNDTRTNSLINCLKWLTVPKIGWEKMKETIDKEINNTYAERGTQIQDIKQGALLLGNRHENGGTKVQVGGNVVAEAEVGEIVINRKSSEKYCEELSEINQREGGKAFSCKEVKEVNEQTKLPTEKSDKMETGVTIITENVEQLFEYAMSVFKESGYDVSRGSCSMTDYGHSCYFYVNEPDGNYQDRRKIRVSDHSVSSKARLDSEYFIFTKTGIENALRQVDWYFHSSDPNYFTMSDSVAKNTNIFEIKNVNNKTDKILSVRKTKKGQDIYLIERATTTPTKVYTHVKTGKVLYEIPVKNQNNEKMETGGNIKENTGLMENKEMKLNELEERKIRLLAKGKELSELRKELYGNVDIESPKSEDEKELDKQIADVFSEINQIVLEKRKLKSEQMESGGEILHGGLSDNMTLKEIADLHGVTTEEIKSQLAKGVTVEKEHTCDNGIATEIAKDHLVENPQYYDKLEDAELKKGGKINGVKDALENYKNIINKFKETKSNTIDGKFYSPNDLRYIEQQIPVLESILKKRGDLEVGDEGMWHGGEAKIVRFEGDNLILKRPNESKEIKVSVESFSKEFAKFPKQKPMEKKPKKGLKKLASMKEGKLTKKDARKLIRTELRSAKAIKADKRYKAKKAGRRVSASGKVYYEYRENRTDNDRRKRI